MSFYLPRKSRTLWQIRLSVIAFLIISIFIFLEFNQKWTLFAVSAVFIAWLFIISVFLPRHFKSYVITADDSYITVRRGYFLKTRYIIPRSFVLTKTISTPVTKRLGLALVAVKSIDWWAIIPEMNESDLKLLFEKE